MIGYDLLIPPKRKESPKRIKQKAVSGASLPGEAVPLTTILSLKRNSSMPALKWKIYSSNEIVPIRIMIKEKTGIRILLILPGRSRINNMRVMPDSKKQIAVLTFMLI